MMGTWGSKGLLTIPEETHTSSLFPSFLREWGLMREQILICLNSPQFTVQPQQFPETAVGFFHPSLFHLPKSHVSFHHTKAISLHLSHIHSGISSGNSDQLGLLSQPLSNVCTQRFFPLPFCCHFVSSFQSHFIVTTCSGFFSLFFSFLRKKA